MKPHKHLTIQNLTYDVLTLTEHPGLTIQPSLTLAEGLTALG